MTVNISFKILMNTYEQRTGLAKLWILEWYLTVIQRKPHIQIRANIDAKITRKFENIPRRYFDAAPLPQQAVNKEQFLSASVRCKFRLNVFFLRKYLRASECATKINLEISLLIVEKSESKKRNISKTYHCKCHTYGMMHTRQFKLLDV